MTEQEPEPVPENPVIITENVFLARPSKEERQHAKARIVVEEIKSDPELAEAVHAMRDSIDKLTGTIEGQYVARAELEQLVTKRDRNKRFIFATVIAIVSMFGASVAVLGITSYCFLGGEKRSICNVIPAYGSTMDRIIANREATQNREVRVTILEGELRNLRDDFDNLKARVDSAGIP